MAPPESVARALGTAGSAVVFAGATVIIALCGLAVAGIPFLTVMGLCAAAGVGASVLVSLTLLPAIAIVFDHRLTPKRRKTRRSRREGRRGFASLWVGMVTRRPVLTIVAVVVGLGVLAIPAASLNLALVDNGSAPHGSSERLTYDAIAADFGPGYNAPLLVVGNVITSTDPVDDVNAFAGDIAKLPGVHSIGQATPNEGGDTALVQVIPEGSQSSSETVDLVKELRDRAQHLGAEHHIEAVEITGQTAVSIDVSQRLASALLPFGLVVIGLSLVLLAIVFRSLVVPLKATVGYLLSVGASFGVVVAVFQWGWGASLLGVEQTGPVVSFLPIIVMGVLFGLAMDYEVFLVSRISEDYARTGDAEGAIRRGFVASAPVVTAAGIIMVSVFTAFIPTGTSTIKPIALALAFGVFVDAFIVRMTFVPAVLALLGRHAWWLPRWLASTLPSLDIEGVAVERSVELQGIAGSVPLVAHGLQVGAQPSSDLDALVPERTAATLSGLDPAAQGDLAATVAGRIRPSAGQFAVAGFTVPGQVGQVQRRVGVHEVASRESGGESTSSYVEDRLSAGSWLGRARPRRVTAILASAETHLARVADLGTGQIGRRFLPAATPLAELSAAERFALECALATAADVALLVVTGVDRLSASTQRAAICEISATVAVDGVAVLLLSEEPVREATEYGIQDATILFEATRLEDSADALEKDTLPHPSLTASGMPIDEEVEYRA